MDADVQKQCLIRVVDDDPNVRRSWQFVLEGEGWRVRCYDNAIGFLTADDPCVPGCLVLDVRMPQMTGIELQHEMRLRDNRLPIVFISAHGDIEMAVKAVKDGAFDFLPKPVQTDRLISIVEIAVEKDLKARQERLVIDKAIAAFDTLSAREKEVAQGVAQGLLNKQIAFNLNITEKTVIAHRGSLCKKLGIRTGADITRLLMIIEQNRSK